MLRAALLLRLLLLLLLQVPRHGFRFVDVGGGQEQAQLQVDLPGNQGTNFAGGGASTMSQCHPDLTADLTAEARIL